jgi:hypothetical protein
MGLKEERRRGCPSCGSRKVAEILWGYPAFSEVEERYEKGELVFGGCIVPSERESDWPRWECRDCGAQWRTSDPSIPFRNAVPES